MIAQSDEDIFKDLLKEKLIDGNVHIKVEEVDTSFIDKTSIIIITQGEETLNKLVYKQFINNQSNHEWLIYKNILSKDRNLLVPELLACNSNRIILKFIETGLEYKFSPKIQEELFNFIEYKHLHYKNCISEYPFLKQKRYMLNINPYLNEYLEQDSYSILIEKMKNNQSRIIKFALELNYLPKTFEHGDLGYQNIITNNGNVHIIDWAMSNYSNGLGDFVKLIENFNDLDIQFSEEYIIQLGRKLTGSVFVKELMVKERFFQLIRDLNFFSEMKIKNPVIKFRGKDLSDILSQYLGSLNVVCQALL